MDVGNKPNVNEERVLNYCQGAEGVWLYNV
ncbi:hypothetical protein SAMN05216599_102555 [Pseudomonas cichorii]|nr:hypothetical protein SAMN05216599_102555 [Pseudomonas cichorii]